jgi:hypothetical protein
MKVSEFLVFFLGSFLGKFGVKFRQIFGVLATFLRFSEVGRGSSEKSFLVKNRQKSGFGDGLDLSLEALFDAKTPILLGFWGWPF